jgi:hypothetical protein
MARAAHRPQAEAQKSQRPVWCPAISSD